MYYVVLQALTHDDKGKTDHLSMALCPEDVRNAHKEGEIYAAQGEVQHGLPMFSAGQVERMLDGHQFIPDQRDDAVV